MQEICGINLGASLALPGAMLQRSKRFTRLTARRLELLACGRL